MTVVLMPRMQTSRAYEFMGVNPPSFPIYPTTRERGISVDVQCVLWYFIPLIQQNSVFNNINNNTEKST